MRIHFSGTAAGEGWPAPDCRCASCRRASDAPRGPLGIRIEGAAAEAVPAPIGEHGEQGELTIGDDGSRLLVCPLPTRAGAPAGTPSGTDGRPEAPARVDVAVVHAAAAERIGDLRRRGVVDARTRLLLVGGDHRVHSPTELERRAVLWGADAVRDGEDVAVAPLPAPAAPAARRVLVTGGARSGKSTEAERRMRAEPEVVYVATGPSPEGDGSWAERVAAHRSRRPHWWRTEETSDAAAALDKAAETGDAVLFDCAGTWLAGAMEACGMWSDSPPADAGERLERRIEELAAAWRRFPGHLVAVTNEVGMGVVPATRSGGLFRDMLGRLNQRLAQESEEVLLTVAGRVTELP